MKMPERALISGHIDIILRDLNRLEAERPMNLPAVRIQQHELRKLHVKLDRIPKEG